MISREQVVKGYSLVLLLFENKANLRDLKAATGL